MKFIIHIFFLNFILFNVAEAEKLKKISLAETNNEPFYLNTGAGVFDQNDEKYLEELKLYLKGKGFKTSSNNELEAVFDSLKWVAKQWKHDGMNQPPGNFRGLDILKSVHNDKKRYRCVEYGVVLSDVLQTEGFITRVLSMKSTDFAYGGFGRGHVAMEVWVNELNKWIFLDPQFGAYLTLDEKKEPLSYYEVFQAKKNGKWENVKPIFVVQTTSDMPSDAKIAGNEYKKFLHNYFGFMSVSEGAGQTKIALKLESSEQPLTFQGGENNNMVYTNDVELIYPKMNRVTVLLQYKQEGGSFYEKIKSLNIKSEDDYISKMSEFAVQPKYKVSLKTNTPRMKNFEYRIDKNSKWTTLSSNEFDWDALKSENYLEVRSVNKFGRKGPATFLKLIYK